MKTGLVVCLLATSLAGAGCGGSLSAPTPVPPPTQPVSDMATVSGSIYSSVGPEYLPIGNASVQVQQAGGPVVTVTSNAAGLYQVSVLRGSITITASKEGYEPRQWEFELLADTALNFSLTPE